MAASRNGRAVYVFVQGYTSTSKRDVDWLRPFLV